MSGITPGIPAQPAECIVNGRKWRLYGVEFTTADGVFGTTIYAISDEHAAAMVEELKQTARLIGTVEGWVPA